MQTITFSTGNLVRNSHTEVLQTQILPQVVKDILQPNAALLHQLQLIRKVARLDKKASNNLKLQLPFFCAGTFVGGLRNTKNFISAQAFVLDVDNLQKTTHTTAQLLAAFAADEEVALAFASPSGNGIKVIVVLSVPITCADSYSKLYKIYAGQFAQRHQIENCIDMVTADATRVCFYSADETAYYNTAAAAINIAQLQSSMLLSASHHKQTQHLNEQEQEIDFSNPEPPADTKAKADLPKQLYTQILNTLHPERPAKPTKQILVPQILHDVMVLIHAQAAATGIAIAAVEDINYGKKIRFGNAFEWAEVNLFYGKAGFSTVRTPKKGSEPQLALVGERIILTALSQPVTQPTNYYHEK